MKELSLTNSELKSLIDDEDLDRAIKFNWRLLPSNHVAAHYLTNIRLGRKIYKMITLHRFVLNIHLVSGGCVDHIDSNPLNNQKSNLRACSTSENRMHESKKLNDNTTSKYKGVDWMKNRNKWRARIKVNKREYHCGMFDSEEIAAKAYDNKAKELFGEFAVLNF